MLSMICGMDGREGSGDGSGEGDCNKVRNACNLYV